MGDMDHTLYVDESGLFRRSSRVGHPGLGVRVVGGLLLSGSAEVHRDRLKAWFQAALGWWSGPWHATEIKQPVRVALGLQRTPERSLPPDLWPLRRAVYAVHASNL